MVLIVGVRVNGVFSCLGLGCVVSFGVGLWCRCSGVVALWDFFFYVIGLLSACCG